MKGARIMYYLLSVQSQNLLAEGISQKASNLITNDRRTSSIKYYKSAWKKWCDWCPEREISPTRSNRNYILDFFGRIIWEGVRIQKHWKSQVCDIGVSWPVGNIWVGNNSRVSAPMPGILNKRPPQPKYPFAKDAETVLDFRRKLPGNDLLSDKLLTLKVSMLLALLLVSTLLEITNLRVNY